MKRSALLYACLLPLVIAAQADGRKYSFYAQAGYMSSSYIKESSANHLTSATETHQHLCIIFNTGVQISLSRQWRAGAGFTYDHFGTKHRSVEYSNISYMLRCDRIWKEKAKYLLYSGIAAGVRKTRRFEEEKEASRTTGPSYQVYVIGAEYKIAGNVYVDFNAGWGATGILSAGARLRF